MGDARRRSSLPKTTKPRSVTQQFIDLSNTYSSEFQGDYYDQLRVLYRRLDVDGSGMVDIEDVEAFMIAERWPVPGNLEEQFRRADKDGDGALDVEEFLFFMAESVIQPSSNDEAEKPEGADSKAVLEGELSPEEEAQSSPVTFTNSDSIAQSTLKEEAEEAQRQLGVEKGRVKALQEAMRKRSEQATNADEQVSALRQQLHRMGEELDETLEQLRTSEAACDATKAELAQRTAEAETCRLELIEVRKRELEMQDRERGLQERERLLADALQAPRRMGSLQSICREDTTEFLENMADKYRLQSEQLHEQLEAISAETTMLRAFSAWRCETTTALVERYHSCNEATVVKLQTDASVADAELTKLQGTVGGFLPELFMLEEQIKALAPDIVTESAKMTTEQNTNNGLVLRCQVAALQQHCKTWCSVLNGVIQSRAHQDGCTQTEASKGQSLWVSRAQQNISTQTGASNGRSFSFSIFKMQCLCEILNRRESGSCARKARQSI